MSQRRESEHTFKQLEARLTLAISIVAFLLSTYTFASDRLLSQHVLRAAVVSLIETDSLSASLLLVNPGRHDETLYSAQFLFGDGRNNGGSYGESVVGPIVLRPGEAKVLTLTDRYPDLGVLRDEGVITGDRLHIAIEFTPVTRDGVLREVGTIYGVTEWRLSGNGRSGAARRPSDQTGLVSLQL